MSLFKEVIPSLNFQSVFNLLVLEPENLHLSRHISWLAETRFCSTLFVEYGNYIILDDLLPPLNLLLDSFFR